MPINDSIKVFAETTSVDQIKVLADSQSSVSDTLQDILTLKPLQVGFEGLLNPSTPQNEPWVFIVLLFLLILFVYSFISSSGWIKESVHSIFMVKERSSIFNKTTVRDFQSQFFLIIFSTGVISLLINLIFQQSFPTFSFVRFTKFFAVTSAFILIKYLIIQISGTVFTNRTKLKIARENYFNIFIYTGILIFPVLIFKIYSLEIPVQISDIIIFIIASLAGLALIIKLFQIFFENIVDSFYLLLYLCTLEFLPFYILFKVYNSII